MMKFSITTVLVCCIVTSVTRAADPPTSQAVALPVAPISLLEHVQQQLRTISSMEADFVQEKQLAVLKHKMVIRGHFAMEKPDRVIWIVNQPVKYAIRVQGEEIRQWDEDTNKVQVIHLGGDPTFKAISEQIQSWFLGNYKELANSYDVFVISEKPLSLRFAPKGSSMVAQLVQSIDVTFAKDETNIDSMVVHELSHDATMSASNSTMLKFIDPKMNQPIADVIWEVPPK